MTSAVRLVARPVFIVASIRSGSTLLRCILNSHSRVHAPHELHLTDITVSLSSQYAKLAMATAGLDTRDLEHLLWDRLLHRALTASGKDVIVDKTPSYAMQWPRLSECWPEARFVFLLRDPADILLSAWDASPERDSDDTAYVVTHLLDGVERARRAVLGYELRYEDLTADPERAVAAVCAFLGLRFEATMLRYTVPDVLMPGIGDFSDRIRAGQVLPRRRRAAAPPAQVLEHRRRWGYGDA